MITQIYSATIVVSDQDKALDFYVGVLGWEKSMDVPMGPNMRFVTVIPKGAATHLALALPGWYKKKPSLEVGIETGISVVCPDIDATYAELTKRGVRFKGAPEMMPWGKKGTWFFDQDNNEFFIVES